MVFAVDSPSHSYENRSRKTFSALSSRINGALSRYTKPHAVVLDYDDVLSPEGESPATQLIEAYSDAGHVDDTDWDEFQEALENGGERSDRELEGELLTIATRALEGESKKDVYGTTADFVVDNYDDLLREDSNDIMDDLEEDYRVFIVSNNYRILFDALADHSNISENNVYANKLSVDGEGRFDGDLDFNLYSRGKGEVARDVADNHHIIAAAGNSVSDFPLLQTADRAYGVNPTDEFQEKADPDWNMVEDIAEVVEDLDRVKKDKGFLGKLL